jgi:hypothetical protein
MPMKKQKKEREPYLTASAFEALPDRETERIAAQIESETPERRLARSTPLTRRQRSAWRKFRKNMGRPRIGKGIKVISISVEKGLLREVDAFAKRRGITRSELIARGMRAVMGNAA